MRRIVLFVEDEFHRRYVRAVIQRFSQETGVAVSILERSTRGGFGHMMNALREYVANLDAGLEDAPDLTVVASDANCRGAAAHRDSVNGAVGELRHPVIHATPDPHVERWMLVASSAFKAVFGRGCTAPDLKCGRTRYKKLLVEAILEAGAATELGGMEQAQSFVEALDLQHLPRDKSLNDFIRALQHQFRLWSGEP